MWLDENYLDRCRVKLCACLKVCACDGRGVRAASPQEARCDGAAHADRVAAGTSSAFLLPSHSAIHELRRWAHALWCVLIRGDTHDSKKPCAISHLSFVLLRLDLACGGRLRGQRRGRGRG